MTARVCIACVIVLVGSTMSAAQRPASSTPPWRDVSPHRAGFIGPPGHRINYLDWGGAGEPLVLLHGWNSNAHAFDDIAPRLAGQFHVVALSLPGFGASDAPAPGYTLNVAADAIIDALDSLHIERASFAGHSFAGWMLSRLATRHPSRVQGLVYLDAAFDLRRSDSIVALRPLARPPTAGLRTQEDVMTWLRRNVFGMWSSALEAEYRGRSAEEAERAPRLASIVADAEASPEEWSRIQAPVLGICALATVASEFPWLAPGDSRNVAARSYVNVVRRPFQRAECARFHYTVPRSRTIEVEGHHYVFVAHPGVVVDAVRSFLKHAPHSP